MRCEISFCAFSFSGDIAVPNPIVFVVARPRRLFIHFRLHPSVFASRFLTKLPSRVTNSVWDGASPPSPNGRVNLISFVIVFVRKSSRCHGMQKH